ncbi:uncharacterized protein LOC125941538 [Dermacentor silvarum]|uniref:uncharacterized protein LOC125941538 n=1 Tax=Dermacentor silvarum TaxID=543639 RepID=UPI002101B26E|nr:uncharacterized protein LOC125941538 [Dermacentor silvarum]
MAAVIPWHLALVFAATPFAMGCPCPQYQCKLFRYSCRPLPHPCNGRVALGAGFCGCCWQCIKQISIGDPCTPTGLCPGPTECKESLYCDPDQRACLPFPIPPARVPRNYDNDTNYNDTELLEPTRAA